ncbi:hypothetical protein BDZ85DRAFT_260736 [Elsinoe ampelina]|uniref:Uncharacterized protein n=1 Tax=Elsinoe ampelina TaxID=302913 RepID=A0A6A6GF09_9PEZI|nr:hypothetical protein BDZ85DRAFT_260736 [Elsinoe ampelina]
MTILGASGYRALLAIFLCKRLRSKQIQSRTYEETKLQHHVSLSNRAVTRRENGSFTTNIAQVIPMLDQQQGVNFRALIRIRYLAPPKPLVKYHGHSFVATQSCVAGFFLLICKTCSYPLERMCQADPLSKITKRDADGNIILDLVEDLMGERNPFLGDTGFMEWNDPAGIDQDDQYSDSARATCKRVFETNAAAPKLGAPSPGQEHERSPDRVAVEEQLVQVQTTTERSSTQERLVNFLKTVKKATSSRNLLGSRREV